MTSLVDLPFDIYRNYILEKNLEMPILTFKQLLTEWISSLFMVELFSVCICASVVAVIQFAGRYFFLVLWIMCCIFLSVFSSLAQSFGYMSTAVYEFPQGDLSYQIETICRELEFPLEKIELLLHTPTMEQHSCVYYYGFSKKRMVLSVNILPISGIHDSLQNEEVLALVIHQLGHWYKRHNLKKFIVMQTALLIWFFFFIYGFERTVVYEAFGFYDEHPALVGILITIQYVLMPFNSLMAFILMYVTRLYEYEADIFALQLGMKNALQRALIKIYVVSFQFPVLDSLYSKHHFHQPSLLERLRNLNRHSHTL